MTSVGLILRTERERQGREMAEIAENLCITQRYLRAIEQDDLQSLPGSFFYKSFVKQYAAVLGVEASKLQPGIDALTAPLERVPLPGAEPYPAQQRTLREEPESHSPVRHLDPIVRDANRRYFPDRRLGVSLAGLVLMVLACSGFYAWWSKPRNVIARSPQIEVRTMSPSGLARTASTGGVGRAPGLDVTTTTGPDGVNHVVLNLSATEKTWLSITSDGKEVFSGILQPSETKTLTGLDAAKMRVGNAGGLDVRWNGKPIGPIGPRGQVRVILFTPENFQILTPNQTL
jgi:transcriptional regulator with XRE-family HTH domain